MREYLVAALIALNPSYVDASPALIVLQRAGLAAGRVLDKPFEYARMTRIHAEARLRCYKNCVKSVPSIKRKVKYGQVTRRRAARARSKRLTLCMKNCKL